MSPSREVSVFIAFVTKRAARALPLASFALRPLGRLMCRVLPALLAVLALAPGLSLHGQSVVYMGALQQVATGTTLNGVGPVNGMAVDSLATSGSQTRLTPDWPSFPR
jgi:hypothetical protein